MAGRSHAQGRLRPYNRSQKTHRSQSGRRQLSLRQEPRSRPMKQEVAGGVLPHRVGETKLVIGIAQLHILPLRSDIPIQALQDIISPPIRVGFQLSRRCARAGRQFFKIDDERVVLLNNLEIESPLRGRIRGIRDIFVGYRVDQSCDVGMGNSPVVSLADFDPARCQIITDVDKRCRSGNGDVSDRF